MEGVTAAQVLRATGSMVAAKRRPAGPQRRLGLADLKLLVNLSPPTMLEIASYRL
jgi:hypothetical protein